MPERFAITERFLITRLVKFARRTPASFSASTMADGGVRAD